MKKISVSDVVFVMIATTICYLAIIGKLSSEQFLNIASMVFAAYYVHKAQNRIIPGVESNNPDK